MDLFISGLVSSKDFFNETHDDRNSTLLGIRAKYQQNAIVGTLNGIAKRMKIKAVSPAPRTPSTPSLSTPLGRMTFPRSGTHPSSKKKKKSHVRALAYQNATRYTPETPLADLAIPSNHDEATGVLINRVTAYLNELTKYNNASTRKHDISRPCVVCKQTGHDFDGCPALNDHTFLKSAMIKSSLYWENQSKLMTKALLEEKQQRRIHKANLTDTKINLLDAEIHSFAYGPQSSSDYESESDNNESLDDDPESFW